MASMMTNWQHALRPCSLVPMQAPVPAFSFGAPLAVRGVDPSAPYALHRGFEAAYPAPVPDPALFSPRLG